MATGFFGGWVTKRRVYDVYVEEIPPQDYQYMLDHPNQDYGPDLIAATAVCCSVALCAVVLRLISRFIARVGLGKDDYTIVAALALCFVYSFLMVSIVALGFGKHLIYVNPADTTAIGENAWVALIILTAATYTVKLSILLLYRRIFPTPRFLIALWIVGVFCTAYFIASFFSTTFECLPVGLQFSTKPHHCFNLNAQFTAYSFINMFLDISLLVLPMPLIWRLHMNKRRKIQTTGIFCIGLLACIASLLRVIYSFDTSIIDETYYDAHTAVWVTVEINLAVTSACLPSLGPLLRRVLHGKQPLSESSRADSSDSSGLGRKGQSKTQISEHSDTPNEISVDIELAMYESRENVDAATRPPPTADPLHKPRQDFQALVKADQQGKKSPKKKALTIPGAGKMASRLQK